MENTRVDAREREAVRMPSEGRVVRVAWVEAGSAWGFGSNWEEGIDMTRAATAQWQSRSRVVILNIVTNWFLMKDEALEGEEKAGG